MNESTQKSILQMARGAIQERADYEMARILANIMDANTSATVKRKLTLTLELKPDDTRQNIAVSVTAKSTLAATNPVTTALYVADEETVVEMVPQIPGQFGIDGTEEEAPPRAETREICVKGEKDHAERLYRTHPENHPAPGECGGRSHVCHYPRRNCK